MYEAGEGKFNKKFDYMEGQSRGNNLCSYGVPGRMGESWYDTGTKVRSFIKDTLEMPSHENEEIECAHRVNKSANPRHVFWLDIPQLTTFLHC